ERVHSNKIVNPLFPPSIGLTPVAILDRRLVNRNQQAAAHGTILNLRMLLGNIMMTWLLDSLLPLLRTRVLREGSYVTCEIRLSL
ncbi:conserved hypothetical protein, partial [Ricinus communis]